MTGDRRSRTQARRSRSDDDVVRVRQLVRAVAVGREAVPGRPDQAGHRGQRAGPQHPGLRRGRHGRGRAGATTAGAGACGSCSPTRARASPTWTWPDRRLHHRRRPGPRAQSGVAPAGRRVRAARPQPGEGTVVTVVKWAGDAPAVLVADRGLALVRGRRAARRRRRPARRGRARPAGSASSDAARRLSWRSWPPSWPRNLVKHAERRASMLLRLLRRDDVGRGRAGRRRQRPGHGRPGRSLPRRALHRRHARHRPGRDRPAWPSWFDVLLAARAAGTVLAARSGADGGRPPPSRSAGLTRPIDGRDGVRGRLRRPRRSTARRCWCWSRRPRPRPAGGAARRGRVGAFHDRAGRRAGRAGRAPAPRRCRHTRGAAVGRRPSWTWRPAVLPTPAWATSPAPVVERRTAPARHGLACPASSGTNVRDVARVRLRRSPPDAWRGAAQRRADRQVGPRRLSRACSASSPLVVGGDPAAGRRRAARRRRRAGRAGRCPDDRRGDPAASQVLERDRTSSRSAAGRAGTSPPRSARAARTRSGWPPRSARSPGTCSPRAAAGCRSPSVAPDLLRGDPDRRRASGPGTALGGRRAAVWRRAPADGRRDAGRRPTTAGRSSTLAKRARLARLGDDRRRAPSCGGGSAPPPGARRSTSCATQNRELIAALEEVQASRDELERLNAELEETNRGVMALYDELSEELERDQPGRGRALRRDRRQEPAAAARPARPRAGSWPTSATSCAPPATPSSGWPGCCSTRRAEPLTAEQRHQVGLIRGQRRGPARAWSTSCSTWPRPSPAGSSRPSATSTCAALFDELRGTTAPLVPGPGVDAGRRADPARRDRLRTDRDAARATCCATCSATRVKFTEPARSR